LVALVVLTLLAADAGSGSDIDAGVKVPPQKLNKLPLQRHADEARVQRVLASLDLRGRAAQLLLAYPQVNKTGPVFVGGVLFVGKSLNPAGTKTRIDDSRTRAAIPPWFAVDMEGGVSNRLSKVKALKAMPSAAQMSELDDGEVEQWGRRVGVAMKSLGLNLNLAPVLDVAPKGHMERNGRSFAGDADTVVEKASAYSLGLLEEGVVPIGKHFPGYGDIDQDSDHRLVTSDWPRERVLKETQAFARAAGMLGGVMLANVVYPSVEAKPAILSPKMVQMVHEHDWLAVTDDLSIKVLADSIGGTSEDVLKQAFLAGNDLLLTTAPPDWDKGIDYVGILSELAQSSPQAKQTLDAACTRVLRLKDRQGLLDGL
jgi:beta-N-acetylhexosaminidase